MHFSFPLWTGQLSLAQPALFRMLQREKVGAIVWPEKGYMYVPPVPFSLFCLRMMRQKHFLIDSRPEHNFGLMELIFRSI